MSPIYVGPANGGRKIYGPLSSAPSSGLADGDEYYNTAEHQKYIYSTYKMCYSYADFQWIK